MNIISKFRDYYDHMFTVYGQDPNLRWNRETSLVPHSNVPYSTLDFVRFVRDNATKGQEHEPFVIVIGTEVFHFVTIREIKYINSSTKTITREWSLTGAEYMEQFNPKRNSHWTWWRSDNLLNPEPWRALRKSLDTPCIAYLEYKGTSGVYKNPCLRDTPLTREVDPASCATLLMRAVQNQNPVVDPLPLTDKTRIQAAGFDLKTSFRHRK